MQFQAQRIAFIGTGQMATALAQGFAGELLSASQISGYDPVAAARERFAAAVPGVVAEEQPAA